MIPPHRAVVRALRAGLAEIYESGSGDALWNTLLPDHFDTSEVLAIERAAGAEDEIDAITVTADPTQILVDAVSPSVELPFTPTKWAFEGDITLTVTYPATVTVNGTTVEDGPGHSEIVAVAGTEATGKTWTAVTSITATGGTGALVFACRMYELPVGDAPDMTAAAAAMSATGLLVTVVENAAMGLLEPLPATASPVTLEAHIERDRWLTRIRTMKPEVLKGYPRGTPRFPLWTVLLNSENDRQRAIGDRVIRDTVTRMDVIGALEDVRISVWIWADTMDEVELQHRLAKALIRGRTSWFLNTIGYDLLVYAGGADEMPDPDLLPELVHIRSQEWLFTGIEATYTDLGDPVAEAIHTYLDAEVVTDVTGGVEPS